MTISPDINGGVRNAMTDQLRKGQFPGTVADQSGSIDLPDTRNDKRDKKDTSEIVPHQVEASGNVISIRPKTEATKSASPAESPHFEEALLWVNSASPDATETTGRETIPEIVTHVYEQYRVTLAETIELVRNWRNGEECDNSLSAAELERIVTLEYRFAAAREHARNQTPVFAVDPNGKKPAFSGWQAGASTDENRFRTWLTKNPEYNLGTPTDELLVVDVDPKNGGSIDALRALGSPLPDTQVSATPSGGWHFIYDLPTDVRVRGSVGKLAPGIDVRSRGNLIVLPGSTFNGRDYRWVEGYSPKERKRAIAPAWLIELAKKANKPGEKSKYAGKRLVEEDDEIAKRASDYIENHAPEAIEGNGGDQTTYDVACALFDIGASKETVTDLMHRYNEIKCFPIWEADDIVKKVDNAMRYKQNPTGVKATSSGLSRVEIDESKNPYSNSAASDLEPLDESPEAESKRDESKIPDQEEPRVPLATPYVPGDPAKIPPRKWVIRDVLCKPHVSVLIGPAGVSKTNMLLLEALALVTGRDDLLGMPIKKRGRVWFWNQEDPLEELERRLAALRVAYKIKAEDLLDENGKPMLYLNSGVDKPLMLGTLVDRNIKRGKQIDKVIQEIKSLGIDVVIFDPLVEFHDAPESDNTQIKKVVGFVREICAKSGCAGHIAAHTRKPDKAASKSFAGDLDSLRGGAAQGGVVRIAHTLLLASADDAKEWRMERGHHGYVRLDHAKNQFGRKWTEPRWFQFDETPIGMESENVGYMRYVDLGPQTDNRLDILAAAMKKAGVAEGRATTVVESLPEDQRRLFGKSRRHWAREVQKAFFGPPKHEYEGGVLSWECAGERSPIVLKFQSAPTAH